MFKENLVGLRKLNRLSQEELAEKVGVTRQAVAKWEAGESEPTLEKSRLLAQALGVSLDDLVNFEPEFHVGLCAPPKGKHLFGTATLGEQGEITLPAKARKVFSLMPGDRLVVLGDEAQGLALIRSEDFLAMADRIKESMKGEE